MIELGRSRVSELAESCNAIRASLRRLQRTSSATALNAWTGGWLASLVDDLFSRFKPIIEPHLQILDQTGWNRQSARDWLSMRFGERLFNLVDEIKHPAFLEEDEWRLYANSQDTVRFRVSQDRIVPYVELDLSSSAEPTVMPIAEIVIGPRIGYDEAVMSLMTFTSSLGYGMSMDFRRSTAPYR
jgi:hypothetical protein